LSPLPSQHARILAGDLPNPEARGWTSGGGRVATPLEKAILSQLLENGALEAIASAGGAIQDGHQAYKLVPWIRAAIQELQHHIQRPVLRWYDGPDAGAQEVTSSPIIDLFARPSAAFDWSIALDLIVQYLYQDGEAALVLLGPDEEPLRATGRGPDARIAMPSIMHVARGGANVQLMKDPATGYPSTWSVGIYDFRTLFVPASSMVLLRFPDGDDPFRGCSPLEALGVDAQILRMIGQVNSTRLSNHGELGGIIEATTPSGAPPDPSMAADFARIIRETWSNPTRSGQVRTLWNAKFVPGNGGSASSQTDGSFLGLAGEAKENVSAVTSIPGSVLGREIANYATYKGERRRVITGALQPLTSLLERQIRHSLVSRIVDPSISRLWPRWDYSQLDELRDEGEIKQRAEAARALIAASVPRDEAMAAAGIEVEENAECGNVPLLQGTYHRLEDVCKEPEPVPAGLGGQGGPPPQRGQEGQQEEPESASGATQEENSEIAASLRGLRDVQVSRQLPSQSSSREAAAALAHERALRRRVESRIQRAVSRHFNSILREQLAHLERIAEGEGALRTFRIQLPPRPSAVRIASYAELARLDRAGGRLRQVQRFDCMGDPLEVSLESVRTARDQFLLEVPAAERHAVEMHGHACALGLSDEQIAQLLTVGTVQQVEELAAELEADLVFGFEQATEDAASQFSIGFNETDFEQRIARLRQVGVRLSEGVHSTLAQDVLEAITTAMDTGSPTVTDLRVAVRDALDPLREAVGDEIRRVANRATMIARTESTFANSAARYDFHLELKANGKALEHEWLAASTRTPQDKPPGRTRATHAELHQTKVLIGEFWRLSDDDTLRFPGDKVGRPENVIHCRCALRVLPLPLGEIAPAVPTPLPLSA